MNSCKDCIANEIAYDTWRAVHGAIAYPGEMPPATVRPTPFPGPRCASHHRAVIKTRKIAAHLAKVQRTYGLREGEYDRLYQFQNGRCWLCQRATGATRRLSVDHDHKTGEVRGLLCRPCNTILGHARDNPEFFRRAINYLISPPARDGLAR